MEVASYRVFTMPYANIYALVEELAAIGNPTLDQQRLKIILESTTLQMQTTKATSQANRSLRTRGAGTSPLSSWTIG